MANIVTVGNVDDYLPLTTGDDTLSASGYTNALVAGLAGNDIFRTVPTGGTFASSAFSGGDGNDRLIVKANDAVVGTTIYNGGAGTDSLELASNTATITMTATDTGANLAVGAGGTIVASHVERFVIYGSDNVDTFVGSSGNDFLDGRGGVDTYQGSSGNDAYTFDSSDEYVAGPDAGIDTIWTSASVDLNRSAGVENLRLKTGNIDGTGNDLNNLITGSKGDNVIDGGAGNDQLWGKGGSDTFAFSHFGASNRDQIFDFDGNDFIKLNKSVFTNLTAVDGHLAGTDFVVGTAANADHGQVIYDKATGYLSYDADGTGGGAAQDIAYVGKNLDFLDNAHILVG
ncbi:calcium-binding protein [Aureimonas sp. Leaf324]|jgi:Ca2+-binding RTX toxin-like protein|uniref:calcium-binding protein n=1 Tax=Aureimonas sp. Leaf324 TaxID=1736336 RepID=UPI0006F60B04|nr:calcium-binding protein [Aureimonas sp. Leaf324]KQQ81280.1 hypothetical protein ASF65_09785 [Aureimonas sp. Leaf324]